MNPRNTWMLVVLAAGLFAFIYFFERHLQPPTPERPHVLPGLDTNAVTSIEIQPPGPSQFIRVERVSGGWQLTRPIVYPVRNAIVDAFLDALAELAPVRRISAEELQTNKRVNQTYGFDTPQATILVQTGEDEHRLALGNFTAPGDGIYARVDGTPGIDVIGAAFAGIVPTNSIQWRDLSFVNLQGLQFVELDVTGPNGQLQFRRDNPDQPWVMSLPIKARADNDNVDSLLRLLQRLNVVRFVTDDSNVDLEPYGLQAPQLTLAFKDRNTNLLMSVQFGKSPADDTNLVYARTNSSGTIVAVEREDLNGWNADPSTFRDQHLFSSLISQPAASMECYGPDGRTNYLVGITNNMLVVTDGEGRRYPAETNNVTAALLQLTGIKVVPWSKDGRFADDAVGEPELPGMGLAPNPARRYVLRAAAPASNAVAPVIAQVDFGGPNTNHEGTVCARRSDLPAEQTVFAVNATDVDRLPSSGAQLRMRNIWNFDSTNVSRLVMLANGQKKEWDHVRKYLWQPLPGGIADDQARGMYMENLADILGSLTAQSWVGPAEPTDQYGFNANSTQFTVTLTNVSPSTNLSVTFGSIVPGGGGAIYACTKMENENWIFIFSLKDLRALNESMPKDN